MAESQKRARTLIKKIKCQRAVREAGDVCGGVARILVW